MIEFKKEELVDREVEIGGYLMQDYSLKLISEKTGLKKKTLTAHINNMMKKLKTKDTAELVKLLRLMKV